LKALVTGGTGFIGRRLVSQLARRGDTVRCLVRPTSRLDPLRPFAPEFITGDLGDAASLRAAVEGVDRVFHLAGVVQAAAESVFEEVNTQGTRNLVEACLGRAPAIRRFVFVSSIAAAGPNATEERATEEEDPHPVSAYGRSKLAAERAVLAAGTRLPATVIRPPNVLGPGSKEMGAAVTLLRRGLAPKLGNGRPQTSLIDVDDLSAAMILAAESPRSEGQIYYVTDGEAYAWREIIEAVAAGIGGKRIVIRIPFAVQLTAALFEETAARLSRRLPRLTREIVRAARDQYWIYDGSKIERDLGFRPRYRLHDSVRRALEEGGKGRFSRTGREAR
jgi:nucleoside-diphosphate-sugar epimerase